MKILLVREASGVHRFLRDGLRELGHQADTLIPWGRVYQGRDDIDIYWSSPAGGVLGQALVQMAVPFRMAKLAHYDIVNYVLDASLFAYPSWLSHADWAYFKKRGTKLSHYALGCGEFSLPRLQDRKWLFCERCEKFDRMGMRCHKKNAFLKTGEKYSHLLDYSISAMPAYEHAHEYFRNAQHSNIQFPVNLSEIEFVPAKSSGRIVIAHAPTRRGFKGTSSILSTVEKIQEKFSVDVVLLENMTHGDYMEKMKSADIYIDQLDVPMPGMAALEMLAMGKIVITGNMSESGNSFPYMKEAPFPHGSSQNNSLYQVLENILSRTSEFEKIANDGREFVKKNHDHIMIAKQFLSLWSRENT